MQSVYVRLFKDTQKSVNTWSKGFVELHFPSLSLKLEVAVGSKSYVVRGDGSTSFTFYQPDGECRDDGRGLRDFFFFEQRVFRHCELACRHELVWVDSVWAGVSLR